MLEQLLSRLKFAFLLALFLAPVVLMQWSMRVQTDLDHTASSIPPAPEFAAFQFASGQ